jgi:hypothetical protein
MNETLHIRIIKDYAVNVIDDLKTLGAVELIDDEETVDVPQWQIDEGRKIKDYYDKHPDELLSWDEVRKQLKFK